MLAFDLETDGLLDAWNRDGSPSPQVSRIHCMAVLDTTTGREWSFVNSMYRAPSDGNIADGLALLDKADVIAAHNAIRFDLPVLEKLVGWRPACPVLDTRVAAEYIWPDVKTWDYARLKTLVGKKGVTRIPGKLIGKHSLAAWGHRLQVLKGDYGQGRTDWSVFDMEMLRYCVQDTRVCGKLANLCMKELPSKESLNLEQEFTEYLLHQERTGFCFDTDAALELSGRMLARKAELVHDLKALYPDETVVYLTPKMNLRREKVVPFNPTSRQQVGKRLIKAHGWEPEEFTNDGHPKIDDEILGDLPYPEAKQFAELFTLTKLLGYVGEGKSGWLKLVRDDGRIHGGIISTGTPHGRCKHVAPNLAQIPRRGGDLAMACRGLFKPRKGWVLVGTDASGMQLRALAHYLYPYDGGLYVKAVTEHDPHEENRKACGVQTRDEAKTVAYGIFFGAGPTLISKKLGCSTDRAKRIINRFVNGTKGLKPLLRDLSRTAKERGHLIGLDGRRVPLRSAHVALNYLLTSAEAVLMKKATVLFHAAAREAGHQLGVDYAQVAHVHDEFQIECRPDIADQLGALAVEAIKAAGRHFKYNCPLDGEYKVGASWADTH